MMGKLREKLSRTGSVARGANMNFSSAKNSVAQRRRKMNPVERGGIDKNAANGADQKKEQATGFEQQAPEQVHDQMGSWEDAPAAQQEPEPVAAEAASEPFEQHDSSAYGDSVQEAWQPNQDENSWGQDGDSWEGQDWSQQGGYDGTDWSQPNPVQDTDEPMTMPVEGDGGDDDGDDGERDSMKNLKATMKPLIDGEIKIANRGDRRECQKAIDAMIEYIERLERGFLSKNMNSHAVYTAYVKTKACLDDLHAEFSSYKERQKRDAQAQKDRIAGSVIESMIPVLDGAWYAVKSTGDDGWKSHLNSIRAAIEKNGGEFIIPEIGSVPDPAECRTMAMVEADRESGTIVDVSRVGVKVGTRIVREAEIIIAR
jgi:molecular chaperone GrpE (heat shock protein)